MSIKKNLFFLDIDHVLNSDDHIQSVNESAGLKTRDEFLKYFDEDPGEYLEEERVARLDRCLDELAPDPYIVTCSTWQDTFPPNELTKILAENGFTHTIEDATRNRVRRKMDSTRETDIVGTIRGIDPFPNRVVILDDALLWDLRHYQVRPEDGLKKQHIDEIQHVWDLSWNEDRADVGRGDE